MRHLITHLVVLCTAVSAQEFSLRGKKKPTYDLLDLKPFQAVMTDTKEEK